MLGEHIRALKGGRWNHAIDCGDETVIHLADDGAPRSVRRSYRPEFVSGAQVVEIVTHRQRTFPAGEVVARAYSRIADPALAAMFATSESFAQWCTTGRPSPEPGASRAAERPPRGAIAAKPRRTRAGERARTAGAKAAPAGRARAAPRTKAKPRKARPSRRPAPKRR